MTAKTLKNLRRPNVHDHREPAGLYLDRCQIDTPPAIAERVWAMVRERRPEGIDHVVDFGAGDGRFAKSGGYRRYTGYEIDEQRILRTGLPTNARIMHACAFSEEIQDADLCIGNPPYVRNQDLPPGWRMQAASNIALRTGVKLSGLANAWQYFFFLALDSTHDAGIIALVIPFEWVSRPSSRALREYIQSRGWDVDVCRLTDTTFDRVLTTASITIVDKRGLGRWTYSKEDARGRVSPMKSPSGGRSLPLPYLRATGTFNAKRGLSPGTQAYLTLTEAERARCGLKIDRDVVPCVTSLRMVSDSLEELDEKTFRRYFVDSGRKCWLIRTDTAPSLNLKRFLYSVPPSGYQTSTCLNRNNWWQFTMPSAPSMIVATGFRDRPKVVLNTVQAMAVGGVCGVYGLTAWAQRTRMMVRALREVKYSGLVVAHSHGLHKLEINQLNALLGRLEETMR